MVTFLETFGSKVPMISAASMPAFFAAFNATVATGTPFGICKIEKIAERIFKYQSKVDTLLNELYLLDEQAGQETLEDLQEREGV